MFKKLVKKILFGGRMKTIIVDSSVLSCEPGVRIVEKFKMIEDFQEQPIYSGLNSESFKKEIVDFINKASVGDFKDFAIFTIFIGR